MRTIKINGKDYKYHFGFGAMMYYEQLTGGAFNYDGSIIATLAIHYSCLAVSDDAFNMSVAEFSAALDKSPALRAELAAAFVEEVKKFNADGLDNKANAEAEAGENKEPDEAKKKN